MGKPRTFTTLPARAIADTRPTALDLRSLAVIAFHDGMSKVKGSGGGCYAKSATLAALVGTDISNFSKSVSHLMSWGYVVREPQQMDRRRFTLRVVYGDDDSWQVEQLSSAHVRAETPPDRPELVGEEANPAPEIVGEADPENGGISKETGAHYILRSRELDFDESREINSSEEAHLSFSKKDSAEAGLGKGVSLQPHLHPSFLKLPTAAQLVKFEEAFGAIHRDPDVLEETERDRWSQWLWQLSDEFGGEPVGYHAQRLLEEVGSY